jgi:hypothetical protein
MEIIRSGPSEDMLNGLDFIEIICYLAADGAGYGLGGCCSYQKLMYPRSRLNARWCLSLCKSSRLNTFCKKMK